MAQAPSIGFAPKPLHVIAAIVLAAGFSRRMGRAKLVLPVGGKPLVRLAVEGVLGDVDEAVVVVGPDDAAVRDALDDLPVRFSTNPRPEEGQGGSIAAGVQALGEGTEAALVVLGDQPHLARRVIGSLIEEFRRTGKAIVAPVYRGTQGNPVLFASTVFRELATLTGEAGARSVVEIDPARVARLEVDDTMPEDIDTPSDYTRLLREALPGDQVQ